MPLTLNGNMAHWRAADEQKVPAARKMKDCLENSVWEDAFLSRDFVFLPVLLGTTRKARWQCPAPRGFSHTSTRGKRLLTRRISAFLKTNLALSSLSLKVVNITENVVHPLALQKILQTLTLHL